MTAKAKNTGNSLCCLRRYITVASTAIMIGCDTHNAVCSWGLDIIDSVCGLNLLMHYGWNISRFVIRYLRTEVTKVLVTMCTFEQPKVSTATLEKQSSLRKLVRSQGARYSINTKYELAQAAGGMVPRF